MNKKFLSAILFGALMVTSTGTFVSCKDYDEDIDAINSELTNIKSTIAALQSKVDAGNYVTGVTKTAEGITFTFSNGTPVLVEVKDGAQGEAGKDGSIVEVKEGVLYIDGEATDIKVCEEAPVSEHKPAVKIVGGEWAVLNAEGEYDSTGVLATSTTAVQNADKSWTLTIKDAEGNAQEVKVPSASSLITSIDVVPDANSEFKKLTVKYATFAKPSSWAGERELPTNESKVYAVNSMNVRIDPVSAPAQDVEFYLTNTVNHTMSNLKFSATPSVDSNYPLTTANIAGRAAVTNNGLWTLYMNQFVLDKDAAKAFDKDMADNTGARVYAVNANLTARSKYNVTIDNAAAANLTKVRVVDMANSEAALGATATAITVNVGQTYKIDEIAAEDGLMWDMYFSAASATAVETFGLVFDHLNRTFTVTKRPDVVTDATAFDLNVNTLDIKGTKGTAKYKVSLSAAVSGTVAYDAVEYDLTRFNNTANDDYFSLPISALKEALGANWTTWANSVKLENTAVESFKDASLASWAKVDDITATTTSGLTYELRKSDGTTTDVNNFNNIRIKVAKATTKTYIVDTQYFIKVTFKNAAGSYINHVSVPVTFKAPTVAEQFALKSGYVVDGVVNAYYYNYENASKAVALAHYFDAYDADATLAKDTDAAVVSASNGEPYNTNLVAALSATDMATAELSLVEGTITGPWSGSLKQNAKTNTEVGYGKDLIIEATNTHYDGWLYKTDAQKYYSFKIKLMSPIFEGTIKPVSGSTINVTANAETGFAITKDMIELADYNKNLYCVVPDATGTPNNEEGGNDVWKAAQINDVWVTKDANNTYIKKFSMQEYKTDADGEVTQEGAIVLYADPLPNTQATSMVVNVKDCWGYKKAQEVSVTIVKQ